MDKGENTLQDVTIPDVEEMLTNLIKEKSDNVPTRAIVGFGFILDLDDDTFAGWYNGLIPGIKVHTDKEGLDKIENRARQLKLNK